MELLAHQHHSPGTRSGNDSGTSNIGMKKGHRDYSDRRRSRRLDAKPAACLLPDTDLRHTVIDHTEQTI